MAIEKQQCIQGLVLRGGSNTPFHCQISEKTAGILAERANEHDSRYGATLPALGGLVTRAYLDKYQIPESALHEVAIKNHRNAAHNPLAHFQSPVSIDQVLDSPLIADPLRRYHCAPISDGASAVLLSRDEGPVAITGWGRGTDTPLFQDRVDITRFRAAADAAALAFDMARLTPGDVDVVEIHDAFASFELINLEDMGFFAPGQSWRSALDGRLEIGADLAVNTSGGMKARGHPIGATALSGTVEIHKQLTQTAGERQHPGATIGAVQSAGGVSPDSYVFAFRTA